MDDICKVTPASNLPNGWAWHDWDDGSGSLHTPVGTRYFLYDLSPHYATGGIEYLKQPGTSGISWGVFDGSLAEFKEYAESTVKKEHL